MTAKELAKSLKARATYIYALCKREKIDRGADLNNAQINAIVSAYIRDCDEFYAFEERENEKEGVENGKSE
ncbi:MAG: hypothetical protein LBP89_02655 [Helicobacteraceae bacterium]|jgi:hypothetical protein|nr:hypothetical protein [Helicobacteraceae bacterium]